MLHRLFSLVPLVGLFVILSDCNTQGDERSKFASSDSNTRYLHHIDLYDAQNRKLTTKSTQPYSSMTTCGRCHDVNTIVHGWHFNAFSSEHPLGRPNEPWIWTDNRTGTQLPLSYRAGSPAYDPRIIGITPWEMTLKFGARIPGGNMGVAKPTRESNTTEDVASSDSPERWQFSGLLDIDCMICHAVPGRYDFQLRREQIESENFAWAATAALRLGQVDGKASQLKPDADATPESIQEKLPNVTYDANRFEPDGTVFMDLVRLPDASACYQCHSERTVGAEGIEPRWMHDDDIHLRAGMTCADCHRNGIDHHTVRGFEGEVHPSGQSVSTLSCAGCHLGADAANPDQTIAKNVLDRPGRFGSPKPAHAGLPPLHFEKLSCTACHGGPLPREQAVRMMTSLAHGLGSKEHRTGAELPAILGPVYTKDQDGRISPKRAVWPAYWGKREGGEIQPLAPESVYQATRKALRVRKDFVEEVLQLKLSSAELKSTLGEERAKSKAEDWTAEERERVTAKQLALGREQFDSKVSAALEAIEKELNVQQAVYVSSGYVYERGSEPSRLAKSEVAKDRATQMITWPIAHNIRPAGWSIGVAGCTECHSQDAPLFASRITAVGPGPDADSSRNMADLLDIDQDQRLAWNQLFMGRASFKYGVIASVSLLAMTLLVGLGATIARWTDGRQWKRDEIERSDKLSPSEVKS
jgi:hypothetical protein